MNMLSIVNENLTRQMEQGNDRLILHIINSNDTSMQTVDDEITVGVYRGNPYGHIDENSLDAPFVVAPGQVKEQTRLPAENHAVPCLQAGGGRIISREPAAVEMPGVTTEPNVISGFKMQLVFDMTSLSKPNVEPEVERDTIRVSEDFRFPEVSTQNPMGLYCGAIQFDSDDQENRDPDRDDNFGVPYGPMQSTCCQNNGDEIGTPINLCGGNMYDPTDQDCDSEADLFRKGCSICIVLSDMSNPPAMLSEEQKCELMLSDPDSCYQLIKGIDYDVDSDGDGENDSWSALFGFNTQRIRIYDVATNE